MSSTNIDKQFNNISEENKSIQKAVANLRAQFDEFSAKLSRLEKLLLSNRTGGFS
jgi:predicted  nucleic acid-binding Zn-ribbon protein